MTQSISEAKNRGIERAKLQADSEHAILYKTAGILLIIGGVFYVICTFAALTPGTNGWAEPPFVSAATFITAMANHARPAYITWTFFTLVDFLAVPVMIALYFALKGVNRDALIVGIGLALMSVTLDAAVAEVGFFTGTSLSVSWASATDPTMKAAYYVAANQAVLQTEFAWTYSYFTGFAAWLIIALVMRKSFFGKWIGGLGAIVSALFVVDMASVYAVPAIAGNFILPLQLAFVVFYVTAGRRLFRQGTRQSQPEMRTVTSEQQILGK
jgi:hypothetical protein